MLGKTIGGRYHIVKLLARGGFGQTYLAEDRQMPTHPRCVVKQLKPLSAKPAVLQIASRLFNKEAEVLYKLGSHDQIPRFLAHFQENQEFYLVQEFIEGHDISGEITPTPVERCDCGGRCSCFGGDGCLADNYNTKRGICQLSRCQLWEKNQLS